MQRLQRAGDRPGAQIAVAGIPDQAGLVHILAGDVEAEDGDWQMPSAFVKAHQFVASDDLSAADAVRVDQHDVESLDLWMDIQKRLCLVGRRAGWGLHDTSLFTAALVSCREFGGNIAECRDQPVDLTLFGGGRNQHHVVERRDEAAAIDKRDMDRRFET